MPKASKTFVDILDLERLEDNCFRGRSPQTTWQRVFGGEVIGQALVAAARTVKDRPVHSLHAYFILPGDTRVPIDYAVDILRDGGSFSTRAVTAFQHDHAIFAMTASFHRPEPGFEHQIPMPDVPPPENLPAAAERLDPVTDAVRIERYSELPIEIRPVEPLRAPDPADPEVGRNVWIRAAGPWPDEADIHRCVLAYASDLTFLDTALVTHGRSVFDADIRAASLDHSMWFHRPLRADAWHLFVQASPSAHAARGLSFGHIFTRDGVLVASVAQEGLIRRRRPAPRRA